MRTPAISLILLAFVAGCGLHHASSQQFVPRPVSQPEIEARQNFAWSRLPINGDDTPYAQIALHIDQAIRSGVSPQSLRSQYGLQAQRQSDSPQAQFAWAYASWKALPADFTLSDKADILEGVPEALAHATFPRAYHFARIRFLVEGSDSRMWPLGETLLAHDPNDKEVKTNLINCYGAFLLASKPSDATVPKIKQKALSYAQDMLRSDPQKPRYHATIGWVYLMSWAEKSNQNDGRNAIKYFQEYLRLAPANDSWRRQAESFIKMIQSQQQSK